MISGLANSLIGLIVVNLSVLGYGLLAAKLLNFPSSNLAGRGVIGIVIMTAVATTTHYFVPLKQSTNLLILLVGVLSFILLFRRLWIELFVIAMMAFWAFRFSMSAVAAYDHGLYHLQNVIWNTQDSLIPGLANLHTRLGFNSALFALASVLHMPVFGGWSLSFLSAALLEGMIAADLLLTIHSSTDRVARLYCLMVVTCLLIRPRWLLFYGYISPDPIVTMGVLYVVLLFLDKRLHALLLCVPFLITIKLSAAPLLFLLPSSRMVIARCKAAAATGILILCIWLARNVILSGYILFPVAFTQVPVDWAVPKDVTQLTSQAITSWARIPGPPSETHRGLNWIKPWLRTTLQDHRLWFVALMTVSGAFVLFWKRAIYRLEPPLVFAIGFAMLFWFIAAPDLRFAWGFMFALGCGLLAYGADELPRLSLDENNAGIIAGLLIVGLATSAAGERGRIGAELQTPPVQLVSTPTGNAVWRPINGDRCWTIALCSPEPQLIRYLPKRPLLETHRLLE